MARPVRLSPDARRTAALVLQRAGYSANQISSLLRESVAPLAATRLTHELLDQGTAFLRDIGFTYYGISRAEEGLRSTLPLRATTPPPDDPGPEQLSLTFS
ncbi:hypothetical protein ABT093_38005 [Kitasatospora sp. NPDC002551]|uniref:hypothetical protein n=1 Tax=Kitasatospora sp. NPDC002551 TaxID=3154539 RepID=UPI00331CCEAF